ncbi:Uncharacterised protein [uncultured archaeon]|nr:Uncharacterised protein [uncultured archaeon]
MSRSVIIPAGSPLWSTMMLPIEFWASVFAASATVADCCKVTTPFLMTSPTLTSFIAQIMKKRVLNSI